VELFGSLISQAHAQPADLKNEKQRELREALSKYKTRQEALEREQKRLQDEQERLRKAQQKIQQKAPLWRKW
jgi:peptidoglycan hydrolase CwlO-like protein